MSLSKDRVLLEGVSPHGHEREAIAFVKAHLPDIEPFRIWALFELVEPTGRRYEIDLLVLGYHCLYLIEIKSHPGRVGGDVVDFRVTFPDGRTRVMPNPFPLISSKARVLASMLERVMGKGRPWVEPLVFLSADGVEVTLEDAAAKGVVTRKTLLRALQFGEYPGAPEGAQRAPITRHKAVEISQALKSLGLRKSDSPLRVGELAVGELIEETAGTQDFEAQHERMPSIRRRVRTYLVPESPTQERREQLRRAAEREAKTLTLLGDHPAILRLTDYVAEGPTGGPCLVFDHFAEALPLDLFLRQHPTLPFEQRIQILEQLGDALDYCHRKQLLHRGLYPGAVLVRLAGEPARIELRLYNFQLAAQRDGSGGTVHLSALGADRAALYRAPEVIVDPGRASPASDVFSLGVMAYHVLTGSPPGSSLAERKALLLAAGGNLSVAAARDDLAGASADTRKSLDDVVRFATEENPINRADDAMEWVKLLLEAITTPTPPAEPSLDPLLARPGDRLEGGLEVVAPLGTGSTAKVLSVRRADRLFALKIALGPEHDATLRAEAEVLSRLASERIVRFEALLTVGGRACLLTTYAGETLADILTRDGAQSLDYARRWGEDLLRAVEVLEEAGIQHRDIKPANLGVLPGEAKKARHLFLFDFSLSALDPAAVTAGTPAYRDPGVPTRGRWDAAADRYAAAITLYELLTGTRPRPATDSDLEVELDAERFDAAVRGRLVAFFRRTFARDLSLRQEDADTLRSEWVACLVASPGTSPPGPLSLKGEGEERGGEGPESRVSAPSAPLLDLAALTDDTPVEALPLGVRERNALDRSGVVTLRDLLAVPPNQLSAIRGVGRDTARSIQAFRERVLAARPSLGPAAIDAFFPGFRGLDAAVTFLPGVPAAALSLLEDAALGRASELAAASAARVEHVVASVPGASVALAALRAALASLAQGAPTDTLASVESWLETLVPAGKKRGAKGLGMVRQLLGLEPVDGVFVTEATDLARRLRLTPQAVYIALSKARALWLGHPGLPGLAERVTALLERMGGVASVARLAEALVDELPHDPAALAAEPEGAARRREALVRIAAESSDVVLGRVRGLWLATSPERLALARKLGARAETLCRLEPLPSSEEVREALAEQVSRSELSALPPERLVTLAADASESAAPSARLELYPRGLSAERAVRLSAGAMAVQGLDPKGIARVVSARYPEAEPLPPRPALDGLLRLVGLEWDPVRGCYVRPGALSPATDSTHLPVPALPTVHAAPRVVKDPLDQEAHELDERLRLARTRGLFRVLEVQAPDAAQAAERLAKALGTEATSLDAALLDESDALLREWGAESSVVEEADRAGPGSPEWANLVDLMRSSAERVGDRLLAEAKPILLTDPGLLARYQLGELLHRLLRATQADDGPAVFLLVPAYADPHPAPVIDAPRGSLPIPMTSTSQTLRVSRHWIENRHRGG